jgi:hypothetical protein
VPASVTAISTSRSRPKLAIAITGFSEAPVPWTSALSESSIAAAAMNPARRREIRARKHIVERELAQRGDRFAVGNHGRGHEGVVRRRVDVGAIDERDVLGQWQEQALCPRDAAVARAKRVARGSHRSRPLSG